MKRTSKNHRRQFASVALFPRETIPAFLQCTPRTAWQVIDRMNGRDPFDRFKGLKKK